ncbi:hypothetical protein [Acinetobacter shaoyimingii]|nr:hypothetical protein [Acinetobacter shaoyimingii]
MIRRIESLQLSPALISALDDAQQAEDIVTAVHTLLHYSQQWN